MNPSPTATLAELVRQFGGEIEGDAATAVHGINTLERAGPGDISFLTNPKYRAQLAATHAGAVIVAAADRDATPLPRIVTPNPYLYFARVTALFHPAETPPPGVHPSAVVEAGAMIDPSACIGAFVLVGAGAKIGARAVLGSHASIGHNVTLGDDVLLYPRVVIYPGCVIGDRVILHAGVVIGSDGFGLAQDRGRWVKIPQVGKVIVGSDCEIGANTTVDRGALDDTVLEEGVKLDNQIQIGHNVRIGAHTAVAGCVGISGSAKIGARCTIGGGVGIAGHLSICDDAHVSGFTLVNKSITHPGQYTSQLPLMTHEQWLRSASHLRRLDRLSERLRAVESRLPAREEDKTS